MAIPRGITRVIGVREMASPRGITRVIEGKKGEGEE